MEPGRCHYQTLEDAPSENSKAKTWQKLYEWYDRHLELENCGLALRRLLDDIFAWSSPPVEKERRKHKQWACLRKMLAKTALCLVVLAVAWQFMRPWEGYIATSSMQGGGGPVADHHDIAPSPSAAAAHLAPSQARRGGARAVTPSLQQADVWSLSYPQGGGAFPEKPFQLRVGRSVEISPQLVAKEGTTCSVERPLPAGLALNKSTCVIHGEPTQQTTSAQTFVITASNSKTSASALVVLAVGAALPGTMHTVAGSSQASGREPKVVLGFQEELWWPESLCAHNGKLYIGQWCSIAEMDLQSGEVTLLLGDGRDGNKGDGEQKEHAQVGLVTGLVVHREELYFADRTNNVVRKVGLAGSGAPGLVSRVAGTGGAGFAGDGGQATLAELSAPWDLAVLRGKQLLIADSWNHCIRAVDLDGEHSGIITTVAGAPQFEGFFADGVTADTAGLRDPRGLMVMGQMVYVADSGGHRIRSIDFEQSPPKIATFAGGGKKSTDGTPAAELQLRHPNGLTLGFDGKMYVACRRGSHTVLSIDMQQPHHPTRIVAGIGEEGEGADFTVATSSALSHPSAAAAVGEGAIYIAEWGRIRAVTVAKSIEEVPFLGTWSSLKPDGTLASPFSLPASTAYISPALPTTPSDFHFSVGFDGLSFPPSVLGVADMESIKKLATNLQPNGTDTDFNGVAIMLIPEAGNEPLTSIPFPAAVHAAQGTEAITVTGWVSRTEFGDRCEYALKDVMLSEMPATAQASSPMITPHVGIDVPMHVFMAAWGPATQLRIIVENPPLLERSWT